MRMIDKDALLSDIERTIEESGCVNHEGEIMDCVRYASEVDAVPVVRGEWIPIPEHENKRCSVCNIVFSDSTLGYFCPYCGAKMEETNDAKRGEESERVKNTIEKGKADG